MKTHSTAISQNSLTAITHAHLPKDTVLIFFAREKSTRKDWKKKRENERQAQAFHKLNDSIGMYEASIL